jgi:ribosomal-protein-alanine N-acetyltransferase
MSPYTLRPGLAKDIPAMHRLDELCFDPPFRFDFHTMRRFATQPGAMVVLAESGWQLCGFAIVSIWRKRREPARGYVTTLDVDPAHRRQGLARLIMQECERRAAAAGAASMLLHVFAGNEAAIRFYQSQGYVRLSEAKAFYGPGRDGLLYEKRL